MSRKEVNRYYPPDVDPTKVTFSVKQPKKKGSAKIQSVRLMAPFSMKCLTCNEYIAQSRKFNARKETTDRNYLGIRIIKFEVRCPRCYAELVFETDPKNGDYTCVKGCKKNYERPKEVKNNETVDEMIVRLDKELKEEERMKELEKKGGGKLKNGLLGEETAVEQLEKRLIEQQKEKDRIEELELLHEKLDDLHTKQSYLDNSLKLNKDNEDQTAAFEKELDKMAHDAFKSNNKKTNHKNNSVISGDYPESDDGDLSDAGDSSGKRELKRIPEAHISGIVKRKKKKLKVLR